MAKNRFLVSFLGWLGYQKHWIHWDISKFSSLAITIEKPLVKIDLRLFSYISKFCIANFYSKMAHMVKQWFRWNKNAEILHKYFLVLYKLEQKL